jgi:hypothetical protein
MSNFGNLLTITYLNNCGPGEGTTILAPGFHRTADVHRTVLSEGPIRQRGAKNGCAQLTNTLARSTDKTVPPRLFRTGHVQRAPGLDPPGQLQRTISGAEELEAAQLAPSFAAGDVLVCDSWLPHRVDSNRSDESKVGLINVFCRPDCRSRNEAANPEGHHEPLLRGGEVLPPAAAAAAAAAPEQRRPGGEGGGPLRSHRRAAAL